MLNDPKVSILIPSFNHAQFLPAAIESVLAQTYRNIELIIVDDGSSDNSFEIARNYAAQHPAIVRVFTHANRANLGISATVNEGFRQSTGEYFSGLPSDDMLMPDKVEQQVKYLQAHSDVGWVYAKVQLVDDEGNSLPHTFGHDVTSDGRAVERLIIDNAVPGMSVLARRECFERVGDHTPDLLYSDWEFWIRMASQFKPAFLDRTVVRFRVHDYNTSVGTTRDQDLNRGLEVMASLRRNREAFAGELTTARCQALIETQRYRYLFCLGRLEESTQSLHQIFEIYPQLQEQPELFESWLRAAPLANAMPEYFEWTLKQLPGDLRSARQMAKRLTGLAHAAQALHFHRTGDLSQARRFAVKAILGDLSRLSDRPLISAFVETVVGSTLMGRARHFKHGRAQSSAPAPTNELAGKQNGV
jgi:glycosyltransferase involved in cell wall biosynthesis